MKVNRFGLPVSCCVVDGPAAHVGEITLNPDEQVTVLGRRGAEYDVTPKGWGLYATPSLGGRLPQFGLRPVFVRSKEGLHLMLVEAGHEAEFEADMEGANIRIVAWVDRGITEFTRGERR